MTDKKGNKIIDYFGHEHFIEGRVRIFDGKWLRSPYIEIHPLSKIDYDFFLDKLNYTISLQEMPYSKNKYEPIYLSLHHNEKYYKCWLQSIVDTYDYVNQAYVFKYVFIIIEIEKE